MWFERHLVILRRVFLINKVLASLWMTARMSYCMPQVLHFLMIPKNLSKATVSLRRVLPVLSLASSVRVHEPDQLFVQRCVRVAVKNAAQDSDQCSGRGPGMSAVELNNWMPNLGT